MEANQPPSDEDIAQVMERVRALLPPGPPDQAGIERVRHFERAVQSLLRFGASRSDPVQSILAHVGNFWSSAILGTLYTGPLRPSAVQKIFAAVTPHNRISRRMLTLHLRTLEADGLIEREVRDVRNPHVEYRLTPLGAELGDKVFSLVEWGVDHYPQLVAARERYEAPQGPLLKRQRGWRPPPAA